MKTRLLYLLVCLPVVALPAVTAAPAPPERSSNDWPQFRGPNRDDISHEKGLLKDWPAGGPKLLWTYENAGKGYSGPAVVGNKYLTMGADNTGDFVLCLDATKGTKLWQTTIGERVNNRPQYGEGPRCTPTVDGDRVYVLGDQGNLVCLELADGKKVWEKSLTKDLSGNQPNWDYTESPLVDGDKVVVTPGGAKGAIAALDKKTGDVLWRSKGFTDGAQYSSLMIGNACGVKQYVQMTDASVVGVAADDGRLLWQFKRAAKITVPSVILKDDYVFVTSGYNMGCNLIKVTRDGDKFNANEVYANLNMTNHHGGVVLIGDHLYGYSDGKGWECMDFKTGKVAWSENKKLDKGSLTCADGMLYLYGQKDGTCVLVEPSLTEWKEHGRFTIPKQTKIRAKQGGVWTHPVVSNGRLFLRDQDLLFAFDVKK
jgi:outer membrane protein assembly factor BamB